MQSLPNTGIWIHQTPLCIPSPWLQRSQFMEQSQLTSGTEVPDFYHQASSRPQFSAGLSHRKHLLLHSCSSDPFCLLQNVMVQNSKNRRKGSNHCPLPNDHCLNLSHRPQCGILTDWHKHPLSRISNNGRQAMTKAINYLNVYENYQICTCWTSPRSLPRCFLW